MQSSSPKASRTWTTTRELAPERHATLDPGHSLAIFAICARSLSSPSAHGQNKRHLEGRDVQSRVTAWPRPASRGFALIRAAAPGSRSTAASNCPVLVEDWRHAARAQDAHRITPTSSDLAGMFFYSYMRQAPARNACRRATVERLEQPTLMAMAGVSQPQCRIRPLR